jgi:hypothetical protein
VAAPMADDGSGVGALRVPDELRPINRRSCLEEGVTRSSNGGRGMAQRRCKRQRPMASGGRCGEPMAEGGAAARRMRVRRVALAWAHMYLAQEPLGIADRTKARRSASACVYGAVRRHADRPCTTSCAHGVPTRSRVTQFSLTPF